MNALGTVTELSQGFLGMVVGLERNYEPQRAENRHWRSRLVVNEASDGSQDVIFSIHKSLVRNDGSVMFHSSCSLPMTIAQVREAVDMLDQDLERFDADRESGFNFFVEVERMPKSTDADFIGASFTEDGYNFKIAFYSDYIRNFHSAFDDHNSLDFLLDKDGLALLVDRLNEYLEDSAL